MAESISRELALDALRALNSADAMIKQKTGYSNQFRADTITQMCSELGVEVRTVEPPK